MIVVLRSYILWCDTAGAILYTISSHNILEKNYEINIYIYSDAPIEIDSGSVTGSEYAYFPATRRIKVEISYPMKIYTHFIIFLDLILLLVKSLFKINSHTPCSSGCLNEKALRFRSYILIYKREQPSPAQSG